LATSAFKEITLRTGRRDLAFPLGTAPEASPNRRAKHRTGVAHSPKAMRAACGTERYKRNDEKDS
jgi:hypothetical protein